MGFGLFDLLSTCRRAHLRVDCAAPRGGQVPDLLFLLVELKLHPVYGRVLGGGSRVTQVLEIACGRDQALHRVDLRGAPQMGVHEVEVLRGERSEDCAHCQVLWNAAGVYVLQQRSGSFTSTAGKGIDRGWGVCVPPWPTPHAVAARRRVHFLERLSLHIALQLRMSFIVQNLTGSHHDQRIYIYTYSVAADLNNSSAC